MKIQGIEGLTISDVRNELANGGKFVYFTYCISIIIMTYRRPTDIYFIKAHESPIKYGWWCLVCSFLFGWWGLPWGPVYTFQAIFRSFSGKDITTDVMNELEAQYAQEQSASVWDGILNH